MKLPIRGGILSIVCLLTMLTTYAQAPCSSTLAQEYQALMALYQSTNGANWINKTGWSSADPNTVQNVQGWHGVTTNAEGRVIILNLNENNLSGQLPQTINNLCNLQQLHLRGNSLSGSIPDSIGGLVNLESLILAGNQLTGSIPSTIGGLSNLQNLDLNGNDLSGLLPSTIGSLSALRLLYLQGNALSGAIPTTIGNLHNLLHCHLNQNQLTSIPQEIWGLTSLLQLHLESNLITGSIPTTINGLESLESLKLSANQLTGSIPSEITDLVHLQNLDLNGNGLSGSIPSTIGKLTALNVLYLQGNALSGAIPTSIGTLSNLLHLHLNQNQLTSIPSEIGNLTSLRQLHVENNQLTGSIPSTIGNLVNLESLKFSANQLTGSVPSTIGSLVHLQNLDLNNNDLSGELPSSIGNLTALYVLYLQGNSFSGAVPASIGSLSNLLRLHIHENQFTSLPAEIGNLNSLQQLHIEHNALTFSSVLLAKNGFSGSEFVYASQASVDEEKTVHAPIGGVLTLTTSIDRNTTPSSVYQWFKVVNGATTQLNAASADGHTVTIQNIAQADAGTQFFYKITNASASDLTLTSKLQTLQIVTCTAPTLDFQFAEINGTHTFTPALTGENCTATYAWDFGDGTTSSESTAVHSYLSTGAFNVKLTVSYSCNGCPAGELIKEYQVTIENGLCGSIYCDGIGGVGIGTRKTDGFRLSVNGKIRASDIIKVYPQGQWSDFVFEKDYRLPPLKEVELFINKNGHLPGIPSAKEVESAGIDLGAMDAKLLQKIEELTLYMLEQEKRFHEQELKLAAQQKQIDELKKLLVEKKSK